MNKTCTKCGIEKSVDEFHKKYNGYASVCKSCRVVIHRQHYLQNKIDYINRTKEMKARLTARYDEARSGPCMDCKGIFPVVCMELDHRPGTIKIADVSRLIDSGSLAVLNEEIAKCDVVCANCHRVRTTNRTRLKPLSSGAARRAALQRRIDKMNKRL